MTYDLLGGIEMNKVIAISNQKGGCGKTTTAINLAVSLANKGKKVLCVDFDGQANLTMGFGFHYPDELDTNIAKMLIESINEPSSKKPYILNSNGVDFIPASLELVNLENILINVMSRENVFKNFLEPLKANYDYIIIDCLPALNILTINALVASDEVIIPVQGQYFSLKGLEMLIDTIYKVQRNLNKDLKIAGILFTMIDGRSNFQKEAVSTVLNNYGTAIKCFRNSIPVSVKVSDKQSQGQPIVGTKNNSVGIAYDLVTEELIKG